MAAVAAASQGCGTPNTVSFDNDDDDDERTR